MAGLILGRKDGQSIRIGSDIVVTVWRDADHGDVKVRVIAPREVLVLRFELSGTPARR